MNPKGTKVIEREVDHGDLFHTDLNAMGLDSTGAFDIGGRAQLLADPAAAGISELIV